MIFDQKLISLINGAKKLRYRHFGKTVELRVAHNYLRKGKCTADCAFCTWSGKAKLNHAKRNGFVISGNGGMDTESCLRSARVALSYGATLELILNIERINNINSLNSLCESVKKCSKKVKTGVQPGIISGRDDVYFKLLKNAGAAWYCNDLETAPSYFSEICSTHTIEEKINSLKVAKDNGMKTWSGFCMGIGESLKQRLEALETLKEIGADGIILNFFYDAPGTLLHNKIHKLSAEEALKTIAVARIVLEDKPIIIGGGRSYVLGNKQRMIYDAGATGIYLGMFLNHPRASVGRDLKVIKQAGFEIKKH